MNEEASAKIDVLAAMLREEIKQGRYGASGVGRIPNVVTLAKRWNTTRSTVTAVLQLLQSEGVIYRKNTSLIVNNPSLKLEGITKSFEQYLKDNGREVEVKNLIDPVIEPMPAEIAEMFGQQAGVHVVHRMRQQGSPDLPLRIAENWYPASLAGEFVERMRQDDHMDVVGAIKEKHGLYIVDTVDVIIGRLPTVPEAKVMDLVRTEPVVEIRRSNYAVDGTPIMWNKIIHRASQFQFTYPKHVDHWK